MKRILIVTMLALIAGIGSAQKHTIDAESARNSFAEKITVTPSDKTVTITKDKITLFPKKEGVEYTISGYFNGQIVNKTKNTVIKLNNAYIENTKGEAAIYGEAKIELATVNGTTNYLISSGKNEAKTAALHSKKNLVLGGSGTLYAIGAVYHGVKGDDIKIKGSGTLYLQGTQKGSAINCRSLTVEKEKSFKAYLINSKNGVKADNTIDIASGNFYLYNDATGFKTDKKADDPKSPHSITLSGGNIYTSSLDTLQSTEKNAYKITGAKIIEE